jgi:hypothetical protein
MLEGMECVLRPHEMRPYLFTALHLQVHFPHHLLRHEPAALARETVDSYFVEALCSLNRDAEFFAGMDVQDRSTLHPYLAKYLILYFDSEFEWQRRPESVREFARRRQFFRHVPAGKRMEIGVACRIFGMSREEMARMNRKELVRLYRRKAKKLHPDKGGDKESFIRMAEAFACIIERK